VPITANDKTVDISMGVLHLGVEADFRPPKKAHPAFLVQDLRALTTKLKNAGVEVKQAVKNCPVTIGFTSTTDSAIGSSKWSQDDWFPSKSKCRSLQ
jgi:hypothetical protein